MRPSLWICQCIAVSRGPSTCMRYMPTLRVPSRGSRVMTAGSVMNGAASSGQQVWIGSRPRSTSSPVRTTSCERPERTLFGIESAIDLSLARPLTFSTRPCGRLHLQHVAEAGTDFVEARGIEGETHPALGAELVDQQGMLGALDVFEQERGATRLDGSVVDLGDLEVRVDLGGDALELALALEQGDPGAEVTGRRQSAVSLCPRARNPSHRRRIARVLASPQRRSRDRPRTRGCGRARP